jgi:hypothetical protein
VCTAYLNIDQATKLAVMSGMWTATNDTISPVSPICSTANCTFPMYDSLAVCSDVANVTEYLNVTRYSADFINAIANNQSLQSIYGWYPYEPYANVSLPNGVWLPAGRYLLKCQRPGSEDLTEEDPYLSLSTQETNMTESVAFALLPGIQDSALFDFFIIYQTDLEVPDMPVYRAIEVLFYWCVNTYSTTVTAGNASTQIVSSSRNVLSPGKIYAGFPDLPIVLSSGNDATTYTVEPVSALAMTLFLLQNLGSGSFSMSSAYTSEGAGALVNAIGHGVAGNPVFTDPVTGLILNISREELPGVDAQGMEAVRNLTNNIATSLTNS